MLLSDLGLAKRIINAVIFNFICYLIVGLPLGVLPVFLSNDLHMSGVVVGIVISSQYLATFISRIFAGRINDKKGPKASVISGFTATAFAGVAWIGAVQLHEFIWLSISLILISRVLIGIAESYVGTGGIIWGISSVGSQHTSKVISWSGIATYGAIAIGAPIGAYLSSIINIESIGWLTIVLSILFRFLALKRPAVKVTPGKSAPFFMVFKKVLPQGSGLALGGIGFGAIATFAILFFKERGYEYAQFAILAFGLSFLTVRMLFANLIEIYGGMKVSCYSLLIEGVGLFVMYMAASPFWAFLGCVLVGAGFSLIFPALGVEAVKRLDASNRGMALGVYTVFFDVSMAIAGPTCGLIAEAFNYGAVYAYAAFMAVVASLVLVACK
ncbi:MFS transporter [Leeia sp. TBRC 13508]|uniref:MFS transporter n=1 Tax=Leeia speluncae TaxID=2884804 RepID=A0ABS8DAP4_9NEIS|nr:MFS transporter [Leeia speluncae]MCB6184683.1 MFS transporter [Leeia speluncae]